MAWPRCSATRVKGCGCSVFTQLLPHGACRQHGMMPGKWEANQRTPLLLPLCRFVSILTPVRDVLNDVFAGYRPHLLANGSWPQQVGGG